MPDDESQGGVATAEPIEDAAEPAAQPTAGESGRPEPDKATIARGMNDFMRGVLGAPTDADATSKPADADASGEPAPSDEGDVEAGQAPARGADGRFLPRRGVPEVARQREQLRDEVRAEILAEQQRSAETAKLDDLARTRAEDVARYRRLQEVPDAQLSADDYGWREDFKEKLTLLPEVGALHQTLAEQRVAEERTQFLNGQRQQIALAASEFGVDPESWKTPGTTWLSMTRDAVESVAGPLRERVTRLEQELHDARTGRVGAARAPVAPGRSSAGVPARTMNDWLRTG